MTASGTVMITTITYYSYFISSERAPEPALPPRTITTTQAPPLIA
jgi:hypothetical protein